MNNNNTVNTLASPTNVRVQSGCIYFDALYTRRCSETGKLVRQYGVGDARKFYNNVAIEFRVTDYSAEGVQLHSTGGGPFYALERKKLPFNEPEKLIAVLVEAYNSNELEKLDFDPFEPFEG